jgi:hypothetical protein
VATLKFLVVAAVVGYAVVVVLVWALQEKLLFYPQRLHGKASPPAGWVARGGAHRRPRRHRPRGRAGEAAGLRPSPRWWCTSAATPRRSRRMPRAPSASYGEPGGPVRQLSRLRRKRRATRRARRWSPTAIEIIDWAARRADLDGRIAIHGVSLGTGVAVQVAVARPPRCLVLTSPYDSLVAVGQRIYRWLPVRLLTRHPFDSLARAPAAQDAGADADGRCRHAHPHAPFAATGRGVGRPVERAVLAGFGHNDLA